MQTTPSNAEYLISFYAGRRRAAVAVYYKMLRAKTLAARILLQGLIDAIEDHDMN